MAEIEMKMPKMGESVAEATIIKWLKNEGDHIDADESVLEIATDKVDSEVPSSTEGILTKKLFNEGDVVKVGAVIAIISSGESAATGNGIKQEASAVNSNLPPKQTAAIAEKVPYIPAPSIAKSNGSARFYSPLVRTIAAAESVTADELATIEGTGAEARVTKRDILGYIERRTKIKSQPEIKISAPSSATAPSPPVVKSPPVMPVFSGENEIIEMDRMRKLIADHMVMSKHTSPHVTSFVEADVTNMVAWRNKTKDAFEKREKEKLTFTPLFVEAVARAIRDFPMINVSVDGTKIILKKNINIGMATALPSGNLIVPVIRNADYMNLLGLTKTVNDLANRARNNKLMPDEIQGGTYTISNVGTFGNVMGTPIINQPQVAILALGAIRKVPAVIETPEGDLIGIRSKMFLSHSYDHRVVDGALGGSFVRRVADYLEQFDPNRSI